MRVCEAARALVNEQYSIYNEALLPALAAEGVHMLSHGERKAAEQRWVKSYFRREVLPLLVPVALDPAHPFPMVANKSLNFIVRLAGRDAFGRENEVAIVKVPRALPRLIPMPLARAAAPARPGAGARARRAARRRVFVSISSVIRSHLHELFPGRQVLQFAQFRVTRHSDLSVDEEDVRDLRHALRQGLQQRHYGQAVRLEVSAGCSDFLAEFLKRQFNLPEVALFRAHGPVNLVRLNQLIELLDKPDLLFAPYRASHPSQLSGSRSIFDQLRERDVLIHQPFESFDGVLDFLREAVLDPAVLAIRQTIYRTGSDTVMLDLLRQAVARGKDVTAVVELKARFDEEVNIGSAERLEAVGAQVVYGVVGLKTHAKMLLVTRREGRSLRRYGHLSTGNYNVRTTRLYTDLSLLTADPRLTADMQAMFVHLTGQSRLPKLRELWSAPFDLHRNLLARLSGLAAQASQGTACRLVVKMNALTDQALAQALIDAARAGVQIDLIVRGACILPAQVPGAEGRIRVRSVIGRFLEHTRVFYFVAGDEKALYLSSADWMNRNMMRRIELAWPVHDLALRDRIVDECLNNYLADNVDAWLLMPDGSYQRTHADAQHPPRGAQASLMHRHAQTRGQA